MTAEEMELIFKDEDQIEVGSEVLAHWTTGGLTHEAPAVVLKKNSKSFRVELLKAASVSCPAGTGITVPRIDNVRLWSPNNCAVLMGGAVEKAWAAS